MLCTYEGLPLSWEVSITGWDAEEESIVALKDVGSDGLDSSILGRGVHLLEDLLRQSLLNSEKGSVSDNAIFVCNKLPSYW